MAQPDSEDLYEEDFVEEDIAEEVPTSPVKVQDKATKPADPPGPGLGDDKKAASGDAGAGKVMEFTLTCYAGNAFVKEIRVPSSADWPHILVPPPPLPSSIASPWLPFASQPVPLFCLSASFHSPPCLSVGWVGGAGLLSSCTAAAAAVRP